MEILGFLGDALSPMNVALALIGVLGGTVIGALPGLSATMAIAVMAPFTFAMTPASGLIMLGAIYTGAIYGGAFAAILVNTPGTPSAIATTFDGYPMARRGDGDLAITLATLGSVAGGLFGALALLTLAPWLAEAALRFGSTEYFWLAVLGLTLIAVLSEGALLKGLMGGCLGLLLSMVGVAVVGGDVRFTFGQPALLGGVGIIPALIGLYCVPVLIDLVASPDRHLAPPPPGRGFRIAEAGAIAGRNWLNILRSSAIGTGVGILPGAGGSIAALVAYSEARRAAPEPTRFGKGEPAGLLASESANNATVGGGFIPTLVLGIPGTPPDAVILGALMVQGVRTGPTLFSAQAETAFTFIFGLLIATVLMLPVGLLVGRYAYRFIVNTPKAMLTPLIAFMTVLGSFAVHNDPRDVAQMTLIGLAGWLLNRAGHGPSPIVLGLVLGQIAEQGFVRAYMIGGARGDFAGQLLLGRPLSWAIVALIALTLAAPLWRAARRPQPSGRREAPPPSGGGARGDRAGALAAAGFLVLGAYAVTHSLAMTPMAAIFPRTVGVALAALSVAQLARLLGARGAGERQQVSLPGAGRRAALAAIMLIWALAFPVLGFVVTSLAATMALSAAAQFERMPPAALATRAAALAAMVGAFHWLMTAVLNIPMPQAWLF